MGDVNAITVPPAAGNATQPHLSGGIVRLLHGESVSETANGPLADFKLSLNKHNVCELSTPEYFSKIQPHQHTSGSPSVGVYSYSFALQPERFQPTGSCNMSRVEDASVTVTLKTGATVNKSMEMFATNYNVLDVQKGIASLAFTN